MAPTRCFHYYSATLFLQQMGAEFADKYPKIGLAAPPPRRQCEDPHVERRDPGRGFLAARVHHKSTDEFPEITKRC